METKGFLAVIDAATDSPVVIEGKDGRAVVIFRGGKFRDDSPVTGVFAVYSSIGDAYDRAETGILRSDEKILFIKEV